MAATANIYPFIRKQKNKIMSTSKFFAGALVGIVVGLLIAPEKGEEMREEIADTAEKWKKQISRMVGKTGAELEDLKKLLGTEIEGLNDDVRQRILNIINESHEGMANIKQGIAAEL